MDETQVPGGILPETEADGGHAFTAEAPEHDSAARAVIPVVGIGASAGGLEVFKRLLVTRPPPAETQVATPAPTVPETTLPATASRLPLIALFGLLAPEPWPSA
jgi:hypothetical protein